LQPVEDQFRSRFILKNHSSWKESKQEKRKIMRRKEGREELLWTDTKLHSPCRCTRDEVEKWGMKL